MGSIHERSAAIFSIHLAQYSPAATLGQEDSVIVGNSMGRSLAGKGLGLSHPFHQRMRWNRSENAMDSHALNSFLHLQVSKLMFVDMPGSERLAMDPELLRLREGQVR